MSCWIRWEYDQNMSKHGSFKVPVINISVKAFISAAVTSFHGPARGVYVRVCRACQLVQLLITSRSNLPKEVCGERSNGDDLEPNWEEIGHGR